MGCEEYGKPVDDGVTALAAGAANGVGLRAGGVQRQRVVADRADEPAEVVLGEGADAHVLSVVRLRDTMEV